jgi:hypothetical protein
MTRPRGEFREITMRLLFGRYDIVLRVMPIKPMEFV